MQNYQLPISLCALASAALLTAPAAAGEAEDSLIAKVTSAYGGDRLTGMRSIRVNDVYKNAFPGQGFTPVHVEFTPLKQDAQLDLVNERGSVEAWSANWNFSFNTRTVSVDDDIVAINYASGTYQPAAGPDYYTAYGAVIRVTDTLLAYELANRSDTAEHRGKEIYLGREHDILTFEIPASPVLTLHIDSDSGLISKMTRETGFGELTYQFRNHKKSAGVTYAKDFEFFVGADVNILTLSRDVTPNAVRAGTFRIGRAITEEPARVDTSEMTVDEVASGVHLAGTGNAYTAFFDAGDYVIGVGGYAGLTDRYNAYKEAAGHEKPLGYQIVTHHHTDHLGGMAEAFALGASFVTPANAVGNLNAAIGEEAPDDRLQIIDGNMSLGPVEIHDIWTNHQESYALVFAPESGVAFQADHYNGVYENAPAPAALGSVMLKRAIDELGLEVAVLLSAHGRKAVDWTEFEAAVANYNADPCPGNRAICR